MNCQYALHSTRETWIYTPCIAVSFVTGNKTSVFLYPVYIFTQYIILPVAEQKLRCPIQFRSFLVVIDPPDSVFESKDERQWRGILFLFQTILCDKCSSRRILLKVSFKHVFIYWNEVYGYSRLTDNVIQILSESNHTLYRTL